MSTKCMMLYPVDVLVLRELSTNTEHSINEHNKNRYYIRIWRCYLSTYS